MRWGGRRKGDVERGLVGEKNVGRIVGGMERKLVW